MNLRKRRLSYNNQQLMQEDSLDHLPQREYGRKVNIPHQKQLVTNFFEIKFNSKSSVVYQFVFDTQPIIPPDSKDVLYHLIKSIYRELREKVGLITFSGMILWGMKSLSIPLSIKTQFRYKEKDFKFDVIIKPTKVLDIQALIKSPDGLAMVVHMYNNKIKGVLREKKLEEVTRGKYFHKNVTYVESVGLNIIRGFKMTLCFLKEKHMALQIDVCSKVFRANNLLQDINSLSKHQAQSLVGSTVITRYGKIKTYRIEKIDYTQTPKHTFFHEKREGKITFGQYYQETYGLKVTQWNQPLIQVISRTEKVIGKEGKNEKIQHRVFLIPEFVSLTGMSDIQKNNRKTMTEIAPMTKLEPDTRYNETSNLLKQINGSEFQVGGPKKIIGYQLGEPEVRLKGGRVFSAKNGTLNFKDQVRQSVPLKDWMVVYSQGKNHKYDDEEAYGLVDLLEDASKAYKMEFIEPGFVACDSHLQSFKAEIKKDIEKNGDPQIILIFLNKFEEKYYDDLKNYVTCELKLLSQFVLRKTIGKSSPKAYSAATKILLQINQKIGGQGWEVIPKNDYFKNRKSMHGAFSISKGKKGFTLAFVGTLNSQNSRVFSQSKVGYRRKEDIPAEDYYTILLKWARNYVEEHKEGPELIMVYREGLSLVQVKVQIDQEFDALKKVVQKIGVNTKKANYNPEVIYIVVNTKINTRIFDIQENPGNQSGKFIPKKINPSSGTIVFDQISTNKLYDFHLVAQKVTQGTCTPTHYIVVRSRNSTMPQEALGQFTYEQCFNYPNWQGAVKVPAMLQCANKLSKIAGESIQKNVTEGNLTKTFYFL